MDGIRRKGRSIFSIGVADGVGVIGVCVQVAEISAIRSIELRRGGKEKSCHEIGNKALHVHPHGKRETPFAMFLFYFSTHKKLPGKKWTFWSHDPKFKKRRSFYFGCARWRARRDLNPRPLDS
jgi:hypothetical protein